MPTETVAERPDAYSEANLRMAAEKLVDRLIDDGDLDGDRDECVANVAEVMDDKHLCDGYELARALESYHYWRPNSRIVEVLDGAWDYVRDADRIATRAWVNANGIKPTRKFGDRVAVRNTPLSPKMVEGFIQSIDEYEAKYTVRCPSLGHVESGKRKIGEYPAHFVGFAKSKANALTYTLAHATPKSEWPAQPNAE